MKRGGKRVYKSVKVLKRQCEKASKKGKRKFGAARKSGTVVPQMSNGFGRPYVGYTVGGTVRFGSRRPEFHYPEHILKGYNTAKDCKKYRFGKSKKIKDERFRDFKKNPLIKEEIYFIKKHTVGLKNKKEMQKFVSLCAKLGKRDLKTKKILVTEKDKKFLLDHGYSPMLLKIQHYCGLNPNTCRGAVLGGAAALGAGVGIYEARKNKRFGKPRKHRELTKKELMALSGLGGLGLGVGGTLGYQRLRKRTKKKNNSLLTPMYNDDNLWFDGEQPSPEIISYDGLKFGSRRPEFHYPEHILKGYNTAKDCKKYRFGQVKPLLERYARDEAIDEAFGNMFANPLGGFLPWSFLGTKAGNRTTAERIAYFMSSAEKKGKKKDV